MKNGFLKRLLFFSTKLLGNKDAKALGDSLNGPQNQPVYRLYSAECANASTPSIFPTMAVSATV